MNMNSDDNTKECVLNPINMDDCSILQHEQCNDTQSNQSIFFDLLSKLERHLDEERKAVSLYAVCIIKVKHVLFK